MDDAARRAPKGRRRRAGGPGSSCIGPEGAKSARRVRKRVPARGETMSPLPGTMCERRDGRKVRNPRRAGSPERDQPTRSLRKALRPGEVGTSPPPRVGGLASRLQATARTVGARALEGRSPGRLLGPALHRVGVERSIARTTPCRRRRPSRLRKEPAAGRTKRQEGRGPERGTAATGNEALKGEAHGRSGASRAGRNGGGWREGGDQTPHALRGDGGIRRHGHRVRRSEIVP
jgi:hypothetical protein